MSGNNSPWLKQLKRIRELKIISENLDADILIVGAGISGVLTAYNILKNTDRSVLILEGSKVAHGASGHNAGQLVSDFERPILDLVSEYGVDLTMQAEKDIKGAWFMLEKIFEEESLKTPISTFIGYNGFKFLESIIQELKTNELRRDNDVLFHPIYIASEFVEKNSIPEEFKDLYEVVPHTNILSLLETKDSEYIAAIALKKGCTNSALFSEEIVELLINKYPERFKVFEKSSVEEIFLYKRDATLNVSTNLKDGNPEKKFIVKAKRIILCTNGFERLKIKNISGYDINSKFHHMVSGDINYMAGYLEELNRPPTALGYYDQEKPDYKKKFDAFEASPYFYLTRRPYEYEDNQKHNLICLGGPETKILETEEYDREGDFDDEMGKKIDEFIQKTVDQKPTDNLKYEFEWHGLICYTPSSMRVIGEEPKNPILLYNLGCNGVGIMTSIFGAWKTSMIIKGDKFPESIFDPKNSDSNHIRE